MSIRIQMVGTGSAFAKKYFNNNAMLYGNEYSLMVDFGITAPMALHQMGVDLDQINGLLITHLHADHVGGVEELAFRMLYQYNRRMTLFIPSTLITTLWENSLKAGLENTEVGYSSLDHYFDVVPLEENKETVVSDGLCVEILRTEHIPNKPSYSLIFNRQFFYSADTRFNKSLLEDLYYSRKCKHIFHDCQLHGPGTVHATLNELLTLPDEIQSVTQLMHYDDSMNKFIGKTGAMTFVEQHKLYELN